MRLNKLIAIEREKGKIRKGEKKERKKERGKKLKLNLVTL